MGDSVQERIEKARSEAESLKEQIQKNREAKNDTSCKSLVSFFQILASHSL